MRVRIDEAGRDNQSGRVDCAGGASRNVADFRDAPVVDRQVRASRRRAGAVHDRSTPYDQIVHFGYHL
jgi:hypothetical protein